MSTEITVGYLLGVQSRPVPLMPGDVLAFGRDPSCNYFFEDAHASRRHATLTISEDRRALLEDLGSTNGTWLNDRRIDADMPLPLKSGDSFRVGGRVMSFVGLESDANTVKPGGQNLSSMATVQFNPGSVQSAGPTASTSRVAPVGPQSSRGPKDTDDGFDTTTVNDPSLAGNLADQSLPQIMQFLHTTANTGELEVRNKALNGVIGFQGGHAQFAEAGVNKGPDAVYALAKLKDGTFRFVRSAGLDRPRNILYPTMHLIFEACRLMDESVK